MAEFTDLAAKKWGLVITVGDWQRVVKETGVDLYKLIDDKCQPLAELLNDTGRFVSVVFCLIEPQADKAEVSPEDFANAVGGETLEQMGEAFLEALADFFPNKAAREALRAMARKGKRVSELVEKKVALAIQQLDGTDEETILQMVQEQTQKLRPPPPLTSAA